MYEIVVMFTGEGTAALDISTDARNRPPLPHVGSPGRPGA